MGRTIWMLKYITVFQSFFFLQILFAFLKLHGQKVSRCTLQFVVTCFHFPLSCANMLRLCHIFLAPISYVIQPFSSSSSSSLPIVLKFSCSLSCMVPKQAVSFLCSAISRTKKYLCSCKRGQVTNLLLIRLGALFVISLCRLRKLEISFQSFEWNAIWCHILFLKIHYFNLQFTKQQPCYQIFFFHKYNHHNSHSNFCNTNRATIFFRDSTL